MARLPAAPTQQIDPLKPLTFEYLGRPVIGFDGDTVASALYAGGVRIFSRSLKYHRPRGLYSLDAESSNTFMAIDGVPNEAAETTRLRAGMSVHAQNVRGTPDTDRLGFIDRLDALMPAGFYYRLFHRPYRLWPFFQSRLRKMAGVGVLDPHGRYHDGRRTERYLNADVAVVGGGPAGMSAALAAAGQGLRVVLFERRSRLGGQYAWRAASHAGVPLYDRANTLARHVREAGIRVFTDAPVTGVWGENLVTGFWTGGNDDDFDECHWECRATCVIVATGRMERPLVFNQNDRPGVMQAGTAWRLARTYGVRPGDGAVFSVGDDLSLEAAADLADLGVKVRAVADARPEGHDPDRVAALAARDISFLPGWAAVEAFGKDGVSGCELGSLEGAELLRLECDVLVANAGGQSRIGALSTAGARLAHCIETHTAQPTWLPPDLWAAGSIRGLLDPRAREGSGRLAGLEAASRCGHPDPHATEEARRELEALPGAAPGCRALHGPRIGRGRKAFVDLDEDGTYKNVTESVAQGFDVPELAKRFGGFGLGPGQYRVPGQNLAMILADLTGTPLAEARPTTVRPPLVPPSIATLAGANHDVHKRTPLHGEQAREGAVFRRAGAWLRARYFTPDVTCREEIRTVRTNVGLLDSSPLGKFRVFGPDALKALQRVYISDMTRAREGRCTYSAMCNDTGNVVDDGVVVREGESDYYFTTSSNRAGSTVEWFRFHTRYDGWNYNLVNLTDVLGSLNLAGPNARRVLSRVTDDDVSNEAFPYMGIRRITLRGGLEVRCLRLGFVGELSYELHAPSSTCRYVWDLLMDAGADLGIRPFGLEAQYCMRAEKGHVIIGAESEQRVTLTDVGMGFLWDRTDTESKKVGAPALRACEDQPGRLKLVGFRVDDPDRRPRDGAIVLGDEEIAGYVCTTRYSETLGWQYGMALVRDDRATQGTRIQIYEHLGPDRKATCTATIVPPRFYDPRGERLRA